MSRRALASLFRTVVERAPDALAASDGKSQIRYAELDRRSDAVARALRAVEPEAGRCVALLCGHRVEAIVGMLGALKAGLCLVPLNVHEGDALLEELWRDADSPAVLADDIHAARARALVGDSARAISIAAPSSSTSSPSDAPVLESPAGDLLAILYTSGTTARPKGVMTTAASVLERALQYVRTSGIVAGERQAAITSWQFAASFPEVYGSLVSGAQLCLYDAHSDGVEGLSDWVQAARIELLQLPVAMARRFLSGARLAGARPPALPSVRFASISGDRFRRAEAESLLAAMAPGAVLLHTYGSTETNLIAECALRLPTGDWPAQTEGGFLPAGRPVPGKILHVLDPRHDPVPAGEVGRIAVESELLSPGYWRQRERTEESFRIGPNGRRVYLTGDFGRLRADGCLEITGRDAAHVKVRGMRVDLAAIEATLLALPAVANAVVVARTQEDGGSLLVAYVEPAHGLDLDTTRLRQLLEGRLPAHSVPARFVFLDAMPWTPNGKLDRRRLPDPGRARPKQGEPYEAPRDAEEAFVCAQWQALFDLEAVGVNDGFFDLGGDSLRLVEMLFDLESRTGSAISLASLAGIPTPARLAALIRARVVCDPGGTPPPRRRAFERLRRELKHPLRAGGPLILGHPLPYPPGVKVHAFLARWLVRSGLFRSALRPIETWHARVSPDANLEHTLVRSFMANTWVDWRLRTLEAEATFERWVELAGLEHLDAVAGHDRGIVFVVTHVHWNALLRRVPALRKREFALIRQPKGFRFGEGPDAIVTERAEQLQAATRLLRRGGVVLIAGDEGHGHAVLERPFHGTIRRFRPGAASLAESTGAALAPVFSRIRDDGGITFHFERPLVSAEATPAGRISDRTSQYAELFSAHWPRIFDSQTWKSARQALEPPDHW